MRTRFTLGVVLGCALLAGCSANSEGNGNGVTVIPGGVGTPVVAATTTSAFAATTTTSAPSTSSSSARSSTAVSTLAANANGYVFVQTRSGRTQCQISINNAGCQLMFDKPRPRTASGDEANGVNITRDGELTYIQGNLGDIDPVTLDYRTYSARGWTIVATSSGTRFTNDATGHGMVVSSSGVTAF